MMRQITGYCGVSLCKGQGIYFINVDDEEYNKFSKLSEEEQIEYLRNKAEFEVLDYDISEKHGIDEISIDEIPEISTTEKLTEAEELLIECQNHMDNTHGYNTDLYKRINEYFDK